jgi:hypothetical protein
MNRLASSLAATFLLSGCSALPTESQLVGTWTDHERETKITSESGVERSYSKQMVDLTFRPDHTYDFWVRGERRADSIGHWHLDGRFIFLEFTRRKEAHKVKRSVRGRIIRLTAREFVYVQEDRDPAFNGVEVHLTRRWSERPPAVRPHFQ